MADYNSGVASVGDYSNIPSSDLLPRDNPLSGMIMQVVDYSNIPSSGLLPRDNPLSGILSIDLPVQPQSATRYYAMRGKDNTGYKTWVASGSPDTSASQYTGAISGTMTDIVVLQSWTS